MGKSVAVAGKGGVAVKTLRELVASDDAFKKQIRLALPSILKPERFLRCLLSTFNKTPGLLECDRMSVITGALTAAQLGLEIDPALGRAYLIPFNDRVKGKTAVFIVGYKGFVELAYRSGRVEGIQCEVVYENDEFEYEHGLDPVLRHVPCDREDRGKLKAVYCIVHVKGGGMVWRVLNRAEVMRHKASSSAARGGNSPWNNNNEVEMWRKTAIRAIAAMIPQSPELMDAVSAEEAEDIGALSTAVIDAVADVPEVTGQTGSTSMADAINGAVGDDAGK